MKYFLSIVRPDSLQDLRGPGRHHRHLQFLLPAGHLLSQVTLSGQVCFLSIEATYPYAMKHQQKARNAPSKRLWMPWAVSLWHKRAGTASLPIKIFHHYEAFDQWERSNVRAGPMTLSRPGLVTVCGLSDGNIMYQASSLPSSSPLKYIFSTET